MRALGGHDAGETRSAQDVAFHGVTCEDEIEGFLPHEYASLGDCDALGGTFFRHVDHAGFAALIDVGEGARHRRWLDLVRFPRGLGLGTRFRLRPANSNLLLAMRNGFGAPRHGLHSAPALRGSRASRARVAAATSVCRIRLSPIRNVETPTRLRRARSAGLFSPLSATTTRSRGIFGANRSLTASDVSNVRKSRLLMPISRDFSLRARASSSSS